MKSCCLLLVAGMIIVMTTHVHSQTTLSGKGRFQLDFDAARFFGDEERNFVELYYGIAEPSLSYTYDAGRFSGTVHMRYEVWRDTVLITKKAWLIPHTLNDTMQLARNQVMTGRESVALPPGDYVITLIGYDIAAPTRRDSVVLRVPVRTFATDREVLSDVELCTMIQSSTNTSSLFYKNTLEVVPNAAKLYGTGLGILYYYVEAYNLFTRASQESVTVVSSVTDAVGTEVLSQRRVKPRLNTSSVEIGGMNLSSLRSGTYIFRLSVLDSVGGMAASSSKKFFVYRPGLKPDTSQSSFLPDVMTSDYATMKESDLDREFETSRYVSTEVERTQYGLITDVPAKRKFLFEFWQRRSSDPSSIENDAKQEYFKRARAANESYSKGFREGWRSDRGRVHIVYGVPDEIERFPASAESLPYEIWHYNSLQGGVTFVFVDRNAMDDYAIVHSTHREELHNENWYNQYALKAR